MYETRNQPEEAIKIYKQAIKTNPDNAAFVERLGDLLVRLGRLDEAQAEIEALTDSQPRDPRVWMKLGAIHYEQKHWEQAVAAFRQAVLLDPANLRTRYFLASALIDSGKEDEARIELEKILKTDPRSVDARVQLGFLYGRAKRYDEAIKILDEAVNLEPKRPELFLYLGTALQRASQYDRAVLVLQEGLSLDDKQKDLQFQLGVVYEKQQRFDDAVRAFRRVLQLDPKHAESYNYIGYMFAEKGINLTEAVDLIQKALAIEPENGYFIDSLGWAYYQQGKYPEALRELQRAVRLAKDDPVLYDHLGDAYIKNGMAAEAIAAWEHSLQMESKGPTAETVQKKLDEARDNQLRAKGGAPKAEQK